MRYQISGKQIDVGEALTTHVKTELGETIDKYSQRPTDATVIFSRNAHEFICDAVVHLSTGLNVQAKGASTEIYAAFEQCKERMDKQLRRYKRRLTDRHEQADHARGEEEAAYTIFAVEEDEEEEVVADAPLVIAETRVDIPTASVADAGAEAAMNAALSTASAKPVVRDAPKTGRNDPCPCGSGKKFKKCCGKDV